MHVCNGAADIGPFIQTNSRSKCDARNSIGRHQYTASHGGEPNSVRYLVEHRSATYFSTLLSYLTAYLDTWNVMS